VYYGTYKGDIDDGSNRFKKWFWNRKITWSLYNHPDEPWIEVCMQAVGGRGSTSIVGDTPQSVYDALAATGVELVKMDFWDGLEYFNTGIGKGSVFLFKPSAKAMDGDSKVIQLKGLDRKSRYALTFQDRTNLNCVMTGAQLIDTGIAVTRMTGDRASEIIWIDATVHGPQK
jgi:hypothetical protein